jgi:PAS domain S-box-containing protein
VVFLNDARHRSQTALSLHIPLTRTDAPAVQAVLGKQGQFEGRDYRNVPVLSDLRPVPDSPWFMIAKVDSSEILAEAHYRAMSTSVIVCTFILLAASVTATAYRRRQARVYRDLFVSERRQRETQKRFRTTLYSIGDAVITTDTEGRVREMNPTAERLTGWSEEEAQGKPLEEVFEIVNQETRAMVVNPVSIVLRSGGVVGLANHTLLIARDGTEHAIADSAAPISDESGSVSGVVLVVSDVTEQYRMREELRRREQEYRLLFEGMLEGFAVHEVICDEAGQPVDYRFLSVNPAFERMTGLRRADVEGRTANEVLPETEKVWIERYGRVALTGEPVHFEEYSGVLGRYFKVNAFRPLPGLFAVVFEDITERKVAEEKIRRLSQFYAVLSQCNQAIVHSTTVEELFPKICHDAVQFGGMKAAWIGWVDEETQQIKPAVFHGEGTGHFNDLQISIAADSPYGRGPTGTAIRENRPVWCQDIQSVPENAPWCEIAARSGWFAAAALPVHRGGKPVASLTLYAGKTNAFDAEVCKLLEEMANDISFALESFAHEAARKQAEKWIRLQSGALGAAANAIIITDPEGVIEWVNAAFTTYTGYSSEEVIGKNIRMLKSEKQEASFFQDMWKTIRAGKVWFGEVVNRRKDGSLYTEEMTITPLRNDAGEITHFIAVKQDITERKQMEEKFLRTQRMESIGTLAAGVAHDLNNILTPISLSADMLRGTLSPEVRESFIATIEECAKRGADVVNQVLTFARGVKGERSSLPFKHIVEEIEKITRETFPKNIAIETRIPADLWSVEGDSTQIHQVLLNLCINARDAMPEGGVLCLSGKNEEIDENTAALVTDAKPGCYTVIEITDNGMGIPREIIGKIFDPFFTTKEVGRGSGLGLSTALGIVRSHGGFVTVESQKGKGTTFRVYLPHELGKTTGPRPLAQMQVPRGEGEMVLIVEDEKAVAKATAMVIERNGYRVLLAAEGGEALELFRQHAREIKVVLSDVMMPGMDGVDLARALRKMEPGVRIVACTGQATETRQAELRTLGVKFILKKPYEAKKLLATLASAMHSTPGKS